MALIDDLPTPKKPFGFKEAVVGHHGLVYTPSGLYSHQPNVPLSSPGMAEDIEEEGVQHQDGNESSEDDSDLDDQVSKKQRQWRRWSEDIIPALIKPYLSLLHDSDGLRDMNKVRGDDLCKGCDKGRILEVSCIFFESEYLPVDKNSF